MGGIIGACVGSMFAGLCCGACKDCSAQKTGFLSRIPYLFLFCVAGIFAIVMSLYGEEKLNLQFKTVTVCNNDACTGNASVYRVSFCLFAFELIHCLIIACGAISFHWLFFAIKFIVFVVGLTLSFVVGVDDGSSNAFFNGYARYFARYVSIIYLLIQILILISWGYKVNEWLQEKSAEAAQPDNADQDEDERSHSCNGYLWLLVLSSLLLYIAAFTLNGLFFRWYGDVKVGECSTHSTLISLTIVICLINGVLSAIRGDGSFFVSAVVSFYCTFLLFAALQSDDNDTCNVWANNRDSASLWIGYGITFLALFWAAARADQISILLDFEDDNDASMQQPLLDQQNQSKDGKDIEKGDAADVDADAANVDSNYEDEPPPQESGAANGTQELAQSKRAQQHSNVFFHFVLMLCSCYMAMLFSNWANGEEFATTGQTSMWVNMATQWATALLFWWTLAAPLLCPSRFGANNNDDN
eukprot:CAMPEP_0202715256 /NCGR_PEP_ID=MMETSP1385-20130828/87423_1 /ASSEMBLY_ACC=CAM_ASM_000861 /TAXON_ID=933848 /ORGANISM="Elphidium margaritaceum" /LENGTH=471 /DNA_ID=CAMNT_0049376429 /DNA_START=41 /DNA_END=1456 /DNA_ORIENTATION=+